MKKIPKKGVVIIVLALVAYVWILGRYQLAKAMLIQRLANYENEHSEELAKFNGTFTFTSKQSNEEYTLYIEERLNTEEGISLLKKTLSTMKPSYFREKKQEDIYLKFDLDGYMLNFWLVDIIKADFGTEFRVETCDEFESYFVN